MIKLTNLYKNIISESQVLDFKNTKQLEKGIDVFLQKLKTDSNAEPPKGHSGWDTEIAIAIYDVLRNKENLKVGNASKLLGFTDSEIGAYKQYFNSKPFNSNGVWSQYNINKENKVEKDGRTYNMYFTLEKNKENLLNFYKKYYLLAKYLTEFSSNNNNIAISFKTTPLLDVAVTENDNLKVYFYDKSYGDELEKIVKDWAKQNNISLSDRLYTRGVDIEGSSFGMLISNILSKTLIDTIKKYKNTYTAQQYVEWLEKHSPKILSNINID